MIPSRLFFVFSLCVAVLAVAAPAWAAVDNTSDVIIGPGTIWLGNSVATGDVNNDGYDDVIAGAYVESNGKVYIHYGTASGPSTTPSVTLSGTNSSEEFGTSVATGDVNNDGYDDVIVGAS